MAVLFDTEDKKYGYGQIEPNRCSFLHDGNIESQCKATVDLENGWIVKVDKANGTVTTATEFKGLCGVNYTAERIYERATGLKNFKVKAGEYPRVGYHKTGDVWTTNAVTTTLTEGAINTAITAASGLFVKPDRTLTSAGQPVGDFGLQVVELTTMPDGAPAVKIQVVPGKAE